MMTLSKGAGWAVAIGFLISIGSAGCGGNKPPPKAPDSDLMDADGDGVGDKEDKCPDKKEDGKLPYPKDGCPKED